MDTGQKENMKRFLNLFIEEKVKSLANGVVLKAVDIAEKWKEWEERWLQNYHGEQKIPHYILRALIHWMGEQYKPYNMAYRREFTEEDWDGEEPELSITVPAEVHHFLGPVEVNVYDLSVEAGEGEGNEPDRLVACEVSIDENGAIIITSATRFPGRLDIFCAAGEMPELQHRQPVFTVNNEKPDADGNILVAAGEGVQFDFTYIVDSDEALADWANNVTGNDYSQVLIKKGTWTSNKEVNLTDAGTKVVVGEAGNLLSFTSEYGLRYIGIPTNFDYWIHGVNVQNSNNNSNNTSFSSCTNLTNCSCYSYGSSNSQGFGDCTNLTNCYGYGIGHGYGGCRNMTNCTGNGGSRSFYYCENLTNCTGTSTGNNICFHNCKKLINCFSTNYGDSIGFGSCTDLMSCFASRYGNGSSLSFGNCENLTNCTGNSGGFSFNDCKNLTNCTGASNGNYRCDGFRGCTNLTNCTGSGNSSNGEGTLYDGNGFIDCKNLTNCTGSGTSSNNNGYGFNNCRIMSFCKPGGESTTATYYNCYMHASSDTNAVSDTAAGGYNRNTA